MIEVLLLLAVAGIIVSPPFMFDFLRSKKKFRGLLVGLDGAGKTTLIYLLKEGDMFDTIPTTGFNTEEIAFGKNTLVTFCDVGGQDSQRSLWSHHFDKISVLAFVIDGSKPERFEEAKQELLRLDQESQIDDDVLCVILSTKMDLPDYVPSEEVSVALGVSDLKRDWSVLQVSGTDKKHVKELVRWLSDQLSTRKPLL
ncbi:hypothetical protein GEMRC1_005147 [Eukaryota sp. GEM-RC1]